MGGPGIHPGEPAGGRGAHGGLIPRGWPPCRQETSWPLPRGPPSLPRARGRSPAHRSQRPPPGSGVPSKGGEAFEVRSDAVEGEASGNCGRGEHGATR